MNKNKAFNKAVKGTLALLLSLIIFTPFTIVDAGHRGVLMQFGEVQEKILGEGIHPIVPLVNTVKKLSVRTQKQDISSEASSKDLQDIFTEVSLNWHIIPEEANAIFREVGDELAAIDRIIDPAIEEVLKAVMAKYTAEELITKRSEVKAAIDSSLSDRLANYHIAVDDISLVNIQFSKKFSDAVESKQIAEQETRRAGFLAQKAIKKAEEKVNLAKGEAEAQRLLLETSTPEILLKQAIDKWDGKLPLIVGDDNSKLLDFRDLLNTNMGAAK